ncbi:MAG TPA: hypothetical protein EYG51_24070 [Pseudomonadales bacterium]|nr:hypothetical protein [Pseudomonadales bacterium]
MQTQIELQCLLKTVLTLKEFLPAGPSKEILDLVSIKAADLQSPVRDLGTDLTEEQLSHFRELQPNRSTSESEDV